MTNPLGFARLDLSRAAMLRATSPALAFLPPDPTGSRVRSDPADVCGAVPRGASESPLIRPVPSRPAVARHRPLSEEAPLKLVEHVGIRIHRGHMGLRLLRVTIGRREDDSVAVRIADPQLAVVRIRIAMNVEQDGRLELACTRHGSVEVVDLEPQEHAVADRA